MEFYPWNFLAMGFIIGVITVITYTIIWTPRWMVGL